MTQFYGVTKLEKLDDWIPVVSEANWRAKHSAFEVAHSWHAARGFPPRVARVLEASESPLLRRLRPIYCIVEKPVYLDTSKGPSWTDVMAYCRNDEDRSVIIAVEGKAKETFSQVVADWVRGSKEGSGRGDPKPSRHQRLSYLSAVLNVPDDPDSRLRYQLLHRTVSAVKEAQLESAAAAMVLIHSFDDSADANWLDYGAFLDTLGVERPCKDVVQGPVNLDTSRNMPTFFAWVSDEPRRGIG